MMQSRSRNPIGMSAQRPDDRARKQVLVGACLLLCATCACAEDREQWQQPDRVLADLHLAPGAAVADIGCGTGYFTFRLARVVGRSGQVYAVDVSADALAKVRERAARNPPANVKTVQSTPTRTGLAPGSLDAAFCCDVPHEMRAPDRAPLFRDVARTLKPGGVLFLIDWRKSRDVTFDPYEKLIPRDDLIRLGTQAGLEFDAEFHYLKYQVFLRFRKLREIGDRR